MTPNDKAKPREFWIVDSSQMNGQQTRVYNMEPKWLIGAVEWTRAIELSAFTALQAENERLKSIIAKEMSENDEFGAEYVHVNILKEENAKLRAAYGVVREALEKIKKRGAGYNLSLSDVNFRLDCDCKDATEALAKAEEGLK